MKKTVFAIVLGTALMLASCDVPDVPDDSGAKFDPLPGGVYIAGVAEKWIGINKDYRTFGAFYWNGEERVDLDEYGEDTYAISASGGRVLVQGKSGRSFPGDGYWVDGVWHPSPFSIDDTGNGIATAKFSGGKICLVKKNFVNSSIEGTYVDGERQNYYYYYYDAEGRYPNPFRREFAPADIVVSGGKIYTACNSLTGYVSDNDLFTYFIDDAITDFIRLSNRTIRVYAIAVTEDGTVYMAGTTGGTYSSEDVLWYYANGQRYTLEGTKRDDGLKGDPRNIKITVAGGKVYVFAYCNNNYVNNRIGDPPPVPDNCYWVDGKKIAVDVPENNFVYDYALASGKLYMAGSYLDKDGQYQACYWIDGQRHDLDGSYANAIYVEE